MKFLYISCLLFFFISPGCRSGSSGDYLVGSAGPEIKEADNLSSLLKHCRFIKLETNDTSLIGGPFGVGKIIKHNGKFYVADGSFGKKICIFDNDGRFLASLSRFGNGPGEYSMITDFDVSDKEIAVIDANKILFYTNDNHLAFIRQIELDFIPWNIKFLRDDKYCLYASRTDYLFVVVNREGKIIKKGFPACLSNSIRSAAPFVALQKENKIIVQSGYSNDLICYDIEKNNFSDMKIFAGSSYPDSRQENEYIKKYSYNYGERLDVPVITNISAGWDRLIVGNTRKFLTNKYYIVNLVSGKGQYLVTKNTRNDITYTDIFEFLNITGSTRGGDYFISYVHPYKLAESLSGNQAYKNEKQYKWLTENFAGASAEEENPVLVEFSFK